MHRNHGILTVGLKSNTVKIVGIIFPCPQPPKPTILEIMLCWQNFIKTTVVHNTTSNNFWNFRTISPFQLFFKSIRNTFAYVRNLFIPMSTVEGNNLRKWHFWYYLTYMDSYKNCHCKITQFWWIGAGPPPEAGRRGAVGG